MMVYIIKIFRDSSFFPAEVKEGGDSFPLSHIQKRGPKSPPRIGLRHFCRPIILQNNLSSSISLTAAVSTVTPFLVKQNSTSENNLFKREETAQWCS